MGVGILIRVSSVFIRGLISFSASIRNHLHRDPGRVRVEGRSEWSLHPHCHGTPNMSQPAPRGDLAPCLPPFRSRPGPGPGPGSKGPRATRPAGPLVGQWQASGCTGRSPRGGPEAVEAGLAVLRDGGNAADAAVATILALSVTDANQFCFGGEVPILVYDARRKVVEVLAGQGAAPAAGDPRVLRRAGRHPERAASRRRPSPRRSTPA